MKLEGGTFLVENAIWLKNAKVFILPRTRQIGETCKKLRRNDTQTLGIASRMQEMKVDSFLDIYFWAKFEVSSGLTGVLTKL